MLPEPAGILQIIGRPKGHPVMLFMEILLETNTIWEKLMADNLKQSFQFIAMSSYFKSDIVNRMGMGKVMLEQSDKMWDRAQKIMHFMLHRGSVTLDVSSAFKLTNVNPFDINGEVKALASTLTTLKSNAEDIFTVHKHANN